MSRDRYNYHGGSPRIVAYSMRDKNKKLVGNFRIERKQKFCISVTYFHTYLLFLPTFILDLPTYLPTYLLYLHIYCTYLPTVPTYLLYLPIYYTYLSSLPTYLLYQRTYCSYLSTIPTYLLHLFSRFEGEAKIVIEHKNQHFN